MKKQSQKLRLRTMTVRVLTPRDLNAARGGALPTDTDPDPPPTVFGCPTSEAKICQPG